jgi:hypothetical protein
MEDEAMAAFESLCAQGRQQLVSAPVNLPHYLR